MYRKSVFERLRAGCRQPIKVGSKSGQPHGSTNPWRQRCEIYTALGMNNRSENEAANQKDRIIFAQHRDSRGCTGDGRPSHMAGLERAQKAIGSERPDREENRLGIAARGGKLI